MHRILLLLLLWVIASGISRAQVNLRTGNLLKTHKIILSEGIGPSIARTDYSDIGFRYNIKGAVEYYQWYYLNHAFGARISGNLGEITASDPSKIPNTHITPIYSLNFGFLYAFRYSDFYYPYASAGLTITYFDPRDSNRDKLSGNLHNEYDKYSSDFFLEAGLKYRFSKNFLAFAEGTFYIDDDDYLDDYNNNDLADFYGTITIGISYALSFEEDSDDDGVPDNWDKCPFTPSNVEVGEYGCPIDNDIDGIPDFRDACPDTPVGIEVDRFGCAFDDDDDSIPNYADDCPDTPKGIRVDEKGCPLDGDGDDVPDYIDLCPNTAEGAEVDSTGCYKLDESKNFSESITIYFDSGDSTISEVYYEKLDRLTYLINNYESVIWYIEGYMDSIEKSPVQESISQIRAKTVWDFLVRAGALPSRLVVSDKGSGFAVGDNRTITGRSKNRRVVIFGIK